MGFKGFSYVQKPSLKVCLIFLPFAHSCVYSVNIYWTVTAHQGLDQELRKFFRKKKKWSSGYYSLVKNKMHILGEL